MDSPIISVIIPVYNAEKTIVRCIDSVLEQSYQDFEILLIDDGSTDGGGEICKTYAEKDNRIRYIKKENGGVSTARNRGIDEAQGKYVTFIDSDDWFESVTLERLVTTAEENNADMVIPRTRMYFCKPDGSFDKYVYNDDDFNLIVTKNEVYDSFEKIRVSAAFYSTCGRLYRKAFLSNINLKFDTSVKVLEDFCFNLACLQEVNIFVHVSDVLYNFYVRSMEGYAFKRGYRDYIISNEKVYLALSSFNGKFGHRLHQGQYDFLMAYWVLALNAIMETEKHRKTANKNIQTIVEKVTEENIYEHCIKGKIDKQYHILFQHKNPFLFRLFYYIKRFRKKITVKY